MCFAAAILRWDVTDLSCSGPHMFKLCPGHISIKKAAGAHIYLQFWWFQVTLSSPEKALGEQLHGVTLIPKGADSETAGAFYFGVAARNLQQLNREIYSNSYMRAAVMKKAYLIWNPAFFFRKNVILNSEEVAYYYCLN